MQKLVISFIKNEKKNPFLILKKLKNTESAQFWPKSRNNEISIQASSLSYFPTSFYLAHLIKQKGKTNSLGKKIFSRKNFNSTLFGTWQMESLTIALINRIFLPASRKKYLLLLYLYLLIFNPAFSLSYIFLFCGRCEVVVKSNKYVRQWHTFCQFLPPKRTSVWGPVYITEL